MPRDRAAYEQAIQEGHTCAWDGRWPQAVQAYQRALDQSPGDVTAQTCLGQAYLNQGLHQEALTCYQQAQTQTPDDVALLDKIAELQAQLGHKDQAVAVSLDLAERHMALGDRASAIASWRRVIQWQPDHAEARRRLSEVYASGGSRQDMHDALQEALALARVYRGRGEVTQAIQECERALALDNTNVEARALLEDLRLEALESGIFSVSVATRRGNPISQAAQDAMSRLAEQIFDEQAPDRGEIDLAAVVKSTADGRVSFQLGRQQMNALIGQAIDYQARDMVKQALARYQEAQQGGARQPEISLNLGILHTRQNHWDQAITCLSQTTQHPDYGLASHFALSQIYQAQGMLDQALHHSIEALKRVDLRTVDEQEADRLGQIYDGLAESYMAGVDPAQATAFCSSLNEFLNNEDWEQRAIDARQRANALAVGDQIATLADFFAVPAYHVVMESIALSQEYLARNYFMAAIDQCQRVIEHAPGYLPIHRRLAEIYTRQGRLNEAVEKYEMLAKTYKVRNELDQAVQVYQDMLMLVPDNMAARDDLITLLQQQGRYDDAIRQHMETASTYLQTLQVEEAVELYSQALKLAPHATEPRKWGVTLYRSIATAYTSRVDWSRAIAALLQAKKLDAQNPELRRQLGELYLKQGRPDLAQAELAGLAPPDQAPTNDALAELQAQVRHQPNDLDARQALAQAYIARGLKEQAVVELDKLGEMQMNQGLFQDTLATIESIVALEPPNVNAYRQLLRQLRPG
ncbi:MAG: tetratricopeptide repeat protein [Chloroflexi bacterium]|nr:tetratricopeptide repeat protein [Chloroflexota bacterium]MBU1749032.1 tetratricopeptide repeat protein [Chloroflexota bacterium]MBU1878855.1 tetratricopeptide repeat protein [Chloroflexota bacterium]